MKHLQLQYTCKIKSRDHLAPLFLCRIHPTNLLIRAVCSSAPMHHAANCILSTQIQGGMYMFVNMLYQTVQILVVFFLQFSTTNYAKCGCCLIKIPFSFTLGLKRLFSHVRLLCNIQLVHLFFNTFAIACYSMIIHVIVLLVFLLIVSCTRRKGGFSLI